MNIWKCGKVEFSEKNISNARKTLLSEKASSVLQVSCFSSKIASNKNEVEFLLALQGRLQYTIYSTCVYSTVLHFRFWFTIVGKCLKNAK